MFLYLGIDQQYSNQLVARRRHTTYDFSWDDNWVWFIINFWWCIFFRCWLHLCAVPLGYQVTITIYPNPVILYNSSDWHCIFKHFNETKRCLFLLNVLGWDEDDGNSGSLDSLKKLIFSKSSKRHLVVLATSWLPGYQANPGFRRWKHWSRTCFSLVIRSDCRFMHRKLQACMNWKHILGCHGN